MNESSSEMQPIKRLEEATNESFSLFSEGAAIDSNTTAENNVSSTEIIKGLDIPSKSFSADDAAKAQLHALTRETYSMSLRQLRQERLSWRMDKVELNHLRGLMATGNNVTIGFHFQSLLREKAQDEVQLEACHDEIQTLKERLHSMQTEQKDLKKELEQVQLELQDQKSQREEAFDGHSSYSSVYHASDARRIHDLNEQVNKWETLFFESAEVGERQIQRLEAELEQVRQELEEKQEVPESESNIENIVNYDLEVKQLKNRLEDLEKALQQKDGQLQSQIETTRQHEAEWNRRILELEAQHVLKSESNVEKTVDHEHDVKQLKNQVQDLEKALQQKDEQLQSQIEATQQREEELNKRKLDLEIQQQLESESKVENSIDHDHDLKQLQNQVQDLEKALQQKDIQLQSQIEATRQLGEELNKRIFEFSQRSTRGEPVAPDPFANRLAAIAKEMNNREAATQIQHEMALKSSKQLIHSLQEELSRATQKIIQLEKQVRISAIIPEEDSCADVSTASSGNEDLEQYILDLEKQLVENRKETHEMKERLDQERIVARNREEALRRQIEEAQDVVTIARNRETFLEKELEEIKQNKADADNNNAIVDDLQARLDRSSVDLEKSQALVNELRQMIDISRQAKVLVAEQSTNASRWEQDRAKLLKQIDDQQELLDDAKRRIEATQRENSQLRQVKDSLMGIDREMEELIESLEPLQNELAEQTRQAEEWQEEAAALKQELNWETSRRQEAERDKKAMEAELGKTKGKLDKLYIELKEEQAAREAEVERIKNESASLKESLEYHKSSLNVLQEAMHEVNEEIRKSTPCQDVANHIVSDGDDICGENDKLKEEIFNLRKAMDTSAMEAQKDLACMRQKLANLESERDAFELEASMAMQERDELEERLRITISGANQVPSQNNDKNVNQMHSRESELQILRQEIETLRLSASHDKAHAEGRIKRLENDLQAQKLTASMANELKSQVKRIHADGTEASAKTHDLESRTEKAPSLEKRVFQPQRSTVPEQRVANEKPIMMNDLGTRINKRSPEQIVKVVASKELKSDPMLQKRSSVRDMVRSTNSAETTTSISVKVKREEPQRPSISVKDMLQNFQK